MGEDESESPRDLAWKKTMKQELLDVIEKEVRALLSICGDGVKFKTFFADLQVGNCGAGRAKRLSSRSLLHLSCCSTCFLSP